MSHGRDVSACAAIDAALREPNTTAMTPITAASRRRQDKTYRVMNALGMGASSLKLSPVVTWRHNAVPPVELIEKACVYGSHRTSGVGRRAFVYEHGGPRERLSGERVIRPLAGAGSSSTTLAEVRPTAGFRRDGAGRSCAAPPGSVCPLSWSREGRGRPSGHARRLAGFRCIQAGFQGWRCRVRAG